jgi:GT2 family glycosyltransferase
LLKNGLVYVLILNWNGYEDTIECLTSIRKSKYSKFRIVVCDNASDDGSVEKIIQWAKTNGIEYDELEREHAETANRDGYSDLVLIQTGANLGFAGGNNVGLRYILSVNDFDYIWVLNNDTIVDADAITELVDYINQDTQYGIIGSKIVYYHNPKLIQAEGGYRYCKWIASILPFDSTYSESHLDYIYGAAMFLNRRFIEKVGLMDERYFLYCEELDWCIRGKRSGYKLGYCMRSKVFHKHGKSIGSAPRWQNRSCIADYYANRSKLLLTKKFYPYAQPTVYCRLIASSLLRVLYGQNDRAKKIIKMIVNLILGRRI